MNINNLREFSFGIGIVLILGFVLLLVIELVSASQFRFEGTLRETSGVPSNGVFPFTFDYYNVSSGGVSLWEENQTLTVSNGTFVFNHSPNIDFYNNFESLWLEISVNESVVGRWFVYTAPFCAVSNNSNFLEGLTATDFQRDLVGVCPSGNYTYGALNNGTLLCRDDTGGSGSTYSNGTGINLTGNVFSLLDVGLNFFTNDAGFITDGNTGWSNIYGFITNSADDLTNYWLKTETYNQSDINNTIQNINGTLWNRTYQCWNTTNITSQDYTNSTTFNNTIRNVNETLINKTNNINFTILNMTININLTIRNLTASYWNITNVTNYGLRNDSENNKSFVALTNLKANISETIQNGTKWNTNINSTNSTYGNFSVWANSTYFIIS